MTQMTTYKIYGLAISTPFLCPTLKEAVIDGQPDVVVSEGVVPRSLDAPIATGLSWQAEPGRYLLRGGRRAGRFLVENGTKITLERNPEAEDEMLAFFFLDAVLAALLRQRGLLVLHANAAVTPSGAVAVSGKSGAGKSTTLAALLARGCRMLADDITVLELTEDGRVQALPGIPQMHLAEDAAAGLGADVSGLQRYKWRRMKAAVPTHAEMAVGPAPLQALYLLETADRDDLHCCPLEGIEKFAALQECVYGPLLAGEHPQVFPLFAAVAAQVELFRIERPAARWTAGEIVSLMLGEGC
jgi:hypothetical protein